MIPSTATPPTPQAAAPASVPQSDGPSIGTAPTAPSSDGPPLPF
jgi:hypothetical protein